MTGDATTDTLDMLRAGLDRIDQGLTLFDADLRLVFVNQTARGLLDLPEELSRPGMPFEEIIRWNAVRGEYGLGDVEEMVAERVQAARQFRSHTLERVRPNGVVLSVSGWPLPGGGFATIYSDITLQRRREVELEHRILKRTEELRQSEERLRSMADKVPAGIAYLDSEGVFRFVNRRFARAYQREIEDIVGKRESEVLSLETWQRVQPYFNRAAKGEAQTFDIPIPFPDGRTLETRTFLRPDRAPDESVEGFYVLTVNITREKMAATALAQAQKMETLGQLSSGIAHDFNNLLTIILGNLKPLAERMESEELRREMVDPAIRATRRGADLMRRLLAVARRQPLSPVPVDLQDCVRTIADLVRPSIGEDTHLVLECDAQTPYAYADPALLEASLINLVVNAADAIEGCGTIVIGTRARPGLLRADHRGRQWRGDGCGAPGAHIRAVLFDQARRGAKRAGPDDGARFRQRFRRFHRRRERAGKGHRLPTDAAGHRRSGRGRSASLPRKGPPQPDDRFRWPAGCCCWSMTRTPCGTFFGAIWWRTAPTCWRRRTGPMRSNSCAACRGSLPSSPTSPCPSWAASPSRMPSAADGRTCP